MCGRFVGYRNVESLKTVFPIDRVNAEAVASYNIAPSQDVLAIVRRDGENWLDRFHWGLVPFWAKDTSFGSKMINARAETIAEKPSFKNAFRKRRCLIPADGFYEWVGPKGEKQPYYITLPDAAPMAFAGLWEIWKPGTDQAHSSVTIITTAASASMKPFHHRMPAILHADHYAAWLDPDIASTDALHAILSDGRLTEVKGAPVSRRVNSVRQDGPENIRSTDDGK